MTTLAIVLTSVAAYVLVGLRYARSQVHRCVERAKVHAYGDQSHVRESANMQMAWRATVWPVAIVIDLVKNPLREWMWQPHAQQQERLERLRKDRQDWQARTLQGNADEQRMASDIVASLDEILTREGGKR